MINTVNVLSFLEKNTKGRPTEDCLYVSKSKRVFAVADGISRSVEEGREYPSPSPASLASRLFCIDASSHVLNILTRAKELGEEDIVAAFREATSGIRRVNEELGLTAKLDYFENDFAGCVAVLGVLDLVQSGSPMLLYGYIGDCGLVVFDKNLNPIFLSGNELWPLEMFREGMAFTGAKERSIFVRKNLRNRPHSRVMTYGALTGEEEALLYVRTGKVLLEYGDTALFFSDGILPFIFDTQFRATLRNQLYSGEESVELGRACIDILTRKLREKHVSNLDDDKAFVAFSVLER